MTGFGDLDRYVRNQTHRLRFLSDLMEWRKIPAVSAESVHRADVARSAARLAEIARACGCTAEVLDTPGHPAVYAERIVDPKLPTVLVYGHYDVQPAGDPTAWRTDPFSPVIRGGKLFGRGTLDDGQLLMHLEAVRAYRETRGEIPVNMKFIAEGEEEIGSEHFDALVKRERHRLAADVILVSDTPMYARGVPSLSVSLRGIVYFELTVTGPKVELHSGEFGGPVENPLEVLGAIQASLKDPRTKRILVPGFYDGVSPMSGILKESFRTIPFDGKSFRKHAGDVPALVGGDSKAALEKIWFEPTLEYNGEGGGYQGEGAKTIIPSTATLKFSCRLVEGQDPARISKSVIEHVVKVAKDFPGVTVSIRDIHRGEPVSIDPEHPAMKAAAESMEEVFGTPAVFTGEGGSIPPVTVLKRRLRAPAVLVGMGLPDGHMHGPNETIDVAQLFRGVRVLVRLYAKIADTMTKSVTRSPSRPPLAE